MAGHVPERALIVLGEDEALALAATMPVGRLIHARGDRVFAAPVNVLLEQRDVLFRTAAGTALLSSSVIGKLGIRMPSFFSSLVIRMCIVGRINSTFFRKPNQPPQARM